MSVRWLYRQKRDTAVPVSFSISPPTLLYIHMEFGRQTCQLNAHSLSPRLYSERLSVDGANDGVDSISGDSCRLAVVSPVHWPSRAESIVLQSVGPCCAPRQQLPSPARQSGVSAPPPPPPHPGWRSMTPRLLPHAHAASSEHNCGTVQ